MNSKNRMSYRKEFTLNIFYSLFVCYIMEALFRKSHAAALQFLITYPLRYFYNAFIIFATAQFIYLFNRRIFARVLHLSLFLILGIINFVQHVYRIEPLTAPDFTMIGEVFKILSTYLYTKNFRVAIIAVIFIFAALVIIYYKAPKTKILLSKKAILAAILIPGISLIIVTAAAISLNALPVYFGNLNTVYSEYGFTYCFAVTIFRNGTRKPAGYSEESVLKLLPAAADHDQTNLIVKKPNIILIEMESFFDPYRFSFLDIDEDPVPVFHSLKENYSHGLLKVPLSGTGTSKTEFEILTGMNMYFMAPGVYPYTILVEKECESAADLLKNLGYQCTAIHNNETTYYERDKVFPNLGFDTYTGIEYMQDVTFSQTGWAKDAVLKDEIIGALKSTRQNDFIFAITVQGHGPYDTGQNFSSDVFSVQVDNKYAHYQSQLEYYIEQIHETDQLIGDLIKELEQIDEETLLIIYGDHSPSFDVANEDLSFGMLNETEYAIWSNFDIEHKEKNLSSNQLLAEVFDRIDYHGGTMFSYHQSAGNLSSYLNGLGTLQYDLLYGENYAYQGVAPYNRSDSKLGWRDILIHSISYENEKQLKVEGENFTPFSRIALNGEPLDTVFIDANTLLADAASLPKDFTVVVQQTSFIKSLLSDTNKAEAYTKGNVLSESNVYQANIEKRTEVSP